MQDATYKESWSRSAKGFLEQYLRLNCPKSLNMMLSLSPKLGQSCGTRIVPQFGTEFEKRGTLESS